MTDERLERLYSKVLDDTVEAIGPVYLNLQADERVRLTDRHGDLVGEYFPGGTKRYDAWAYPLNGLPVTDSQYGVDVAVIPAGHHDTADEAKAAVLREYAAERVEFWWPSLDEGRTKALECDGCGRTMYYSYVTEEYVHAEPNPTCGLAE